MKSDHIQNALVLSTAHMPSTAPDFGRLQAMPFDCGYIVFVWAAVWDRAVPNWIAPIMKAACENGCLLLVFDRDAKIDPEKFQTWDW